MTKIMAAVAREVVRVVRRSMAWMVWVRSGGVRERGVRRRHFRGGMERSWAWRGVSVAGGGLVLGGR